jgi:hypothetical protein
MKATDHARPLPSAVQTPSPVDTGEGWGGGRHKALEKA